VSLNWFVVKVWQGTWCYITFGNARQNRLMIVLLSVSKKSHAFSVF